MMKLTVVFSVLSSSSAFVSHNGNFLKASRIIASIKRCVYRENAAFVAIIFLC